MRGVTQLIARERFEHRCGERETEIKKRKRVTILSTRTTTVNLALSR